MPLWKQRDAGMRMEHFPKEAIPSGKFFFDREYEENYAHVFYEDIVVVHDNYIKGHDRKVGRFKEYHLWSVESVSFPEC